ncbi:formimidoylglutamate deiminase [Actinokineospora bangkokensis]|uniref:Formimidoylglutamate deiminase n=1 Tax=Actinokineospora bangkokensis TaxID=1193682 RepID=A0A1Q9LEA7_9PSEU|nr:formimidoylglutamate deiminase [Actinokineospora bangkokensis]OLR90378.1 formimidoylglutamate deiminase [Actinokineospora bangkokensis]
MTTYWADHAWLPGGLTAGVRIDTAGGTITAVSTPDEPAGTRLPGVVFPGIANAHSHAFHRALRGRTHGDGGTFWTWRERMYDLAARLDPDSYHRLARAAYAEMVLAGYTAVGEFHYLHHGPHDDPNAMGHALIAAARDAGIRLTLLDTCYLAGGFDQPLDPVQQRFSDGTAEAWAERVSALEQTPTTRIGAAIHSVRAVPHDQIPVVVAAVDGPLHVHLSEQPAENAACLARHGRTPTRLLHDLGALGPRTTAVHATHLTDADVRLLAGSTACFCPTTEGDLADGHGPARDLLDAGAALAIGSDQHAVVDPFAEARALEHGERFRTGHRGRLTPAQLTTAMTTAGYASLGWPGGLVPGAPADLVAVRTDTPRTAGALPDQLVLAATASDVDTVVVAGREVVRGGAHVLGDVGRALSDALGELWP